MINPELVQFYSVGLRLSQSIEQRLKIPYATWVHPQDLAMIGLSVFGGEGQDTKFLYLNPEKHAHDMVASYRKDTLEKFGVSPESLEKRYPDLTGNGDFSQGIVANALKRADKTLNPEEMKNLQYNLADLMARFVKIDPTVVGQPNVRLDPKRGSIRFSSGQEHQLTQWPSIVVEYGPGAVACHKIPAEVSMTPQTIFIESNYYINQFLTSAAGHHNVRYPQVITRMDGIRAATDEFLLQNPEGIIDTIIMSMIHSAGEPEITAGIVNAKRLLRPGGLLVVQAVEQVKNGEARASFVRGVIDDTFNQKPALFHTLQYRDAVRRDLRDVFQAVYVR
jgi:hypothetical protein